VTENCKVNAHCQHLRNRPAIVAADCMSLPLRSNSCDAAMCIAVLHHLSTPSRRRQCIEELVRIVKPGGSINIQAWAMEQEESSRHKFAVNDVYVPFNAQPKYLVELHKKSLNSSRRSRSYQEHARNATESLSTAQMYSEAFNADFDDEKGLVVFQRYCHLYRHGELEELCAQVRDALLVESGFESGNHFVILKVQGS